MRTHQLRWKTCWRQLKLVLAERDATIVQQSCEIEQLRTIVALRDKEIGQQNAEILQLRAAVAVAANTSPASTPSPATLPATPTPKEELDPGKRNSSDGWCIRYRLVVLVPATRKNQAIVSVFALPGSYGLWERQVSTCKLRQSRQWSSGTTSSSWQRGGASWDDDHRPSWERGGASWDDDHWASWGSGKWSDDVSWSGYEWLGFF